MYILVTMMLLNLFLLTEINNVCSTMIEEMFVEEILAVDIFMISQNCKSLQLFSDGNQSQK